MPRIPREDSTPSEHLVQSGGVRFTFHSHFTKLVTDLISRKSQKERTQIRSSSAHQPWAGLAVLIRRAPDGQFARPAVDSCVFQLVDSGVVVRELIESHTGDTGRVIELDPTALFTTITPPPRRVSGSHLVLPSYPAWRGLWLLSSGPSGPSQIPTTSPPKKMDVVVQRTIPTRF